MNTRDVPAAGFSKCIITVGWCVLGFCAPAASEADQQKLASANAGFAFRLLKEISKEQPGSNVFISPYSTSTVSQMVCNGARDQTFSEMQRVFGTAGLAAEIGAALCDETKLRDLKPGGNQ
jgi:serine protease inhibitor